jgi:putative pyruvate formate lyase activating enzyme
MTDEIKIAKVMLHKWEEPSISGKNGSGAIFFSGCPLKCVYCQNKEISHGGVGKSVSADELSKIMLTLQEKGAHNVNLVTPTHYADQIEKSLSLIKDELKIPVVYNTSGYETVEQIKKMSRYVSVFLVDIKYFSPELSLKYSSCADYYKRAKEAFAQMLSSKKECIFDSEEIITSGVILRHLVLPSQRQDSISLLRDIASSFDVNSFKLSLMCQYTPDFCPSEYKELCRRVTSFEYDSVLKVASECGYDGYIQERSSASRDFTPDFDGEILLS